MDPQPSSGGAHFRSKSGPAGSGVCGNSTGPLPRWRMRRALDNGSDQGSKAGPVLPPGAMAGRTQPPAAPFSASSTRIFNTGSSLGKSGPTRRLSWAEGTQAGPLLPDGESSQRSYHGCGRQKSGPGFLLATSEATGPYCSRRRFEQHITIAATRLGG